MRDENKEEESGNREDKYLEARFVPIQMQIPFLDMREIMTNHAQITLEGSVISHVKAGNCGKQTDIYINKINIHLVAMNN